MAPNAGSFRRALEITADVYFAAGELMAAMGPSAGVADEGGWWPNFTSNEHALDTLTQAIERAGTKAGNKGWEAAQAGIEMVNLLRAIPSASAQNR